MRLLHQSEPKVSHGHMTDASTGVIRGGRGTGASAASRCPAVAMATVSNPGSATASQAGGAVSVTKVGGENNGGSWRRSSRWLFQTCLCAGRSSPVVTAPPACWRTAVTTPACVLGASTAGSVS